MQTTKSMRVVSVFDPAIDHARTGKEVLEEYATTRDEKLLEKLVKMPGALPVYYTIRRIGVLQKNTLEEQASSPGMRRTLAFMSAVSQIENLHDAEGRNLGTRKPGQRSDDGSYYWSVSEIEELVELGALDEPTISEIGGVALTRAGLRRGSAKQYRLPPSLVGDWDALEFHPVGIQTPSDALPSSEKPDSAPTT